MGFIVLWHDDGDVDTVCCVAPFEGSPQQALNVIWNPPAPVECPRVHLGTWEAFELMRGETRAPVFEE